MTNYLTDYSYFTNKHDLDEAARQHKKENWDDMNETDRSVLDMIRRYSVKYGAAHLKHDTIAEKIGKSNATVRRAIRKLDKLGIIDRIHYIRPVMNGLGANIYAIRPFSDTSKTTDNRNLTGKSRPARPKIETVAEEVPEQPAVPSTLFGRMKELLSSTIGEDRLARRFFSVYRQLTIPMLKFTIHEHKGDLFEQLGIQALRIAVQSTKRKNIRNLPGYYSGILRELIDKALFSDAYQNYDMPIERLYR